MLNPTSPQTPGFHTPHFQLAQILRFEVMYYAAEQQIEPAAVALLDLINLAGIMQLQPEVGANFQVASMVFPSMELFLSQSELSEKLLKALDQAVETLAQNFDNSRLLSHLCRGIEMFNQPGGSMFGPNAPEFQKIMLHLAHQSRRLSGKHDRDFLRFLDIGGQALNLSNAPPSERWIYLNQITEIQAGGRSHPNAFELGRWPFLLLKSLFDQTARDQALVDLARLSIALEKRRLRDGTLPETLAELVPEFFPEIPVDPFDGMPLRYRKTGNEYVLYSIGPDGIDNGGTETFPAGPGNSAPAGNDILFQVKSF